MKPSFVGIGAQKCASTWLYKVLEEHPEIGVSREKEIDFFSKKYDYGYQWYEAHFDGCADKRETGEISPSYFSDPSVPARVHRYNPATKILVTLRDPVQRALSQHRHEVRLGHFGGASLSFEAGLKNNPMYIEQGLYATHLKRWLEYFPLEQIHVIVVDEINSNPYDVAHKAYEFLGVDGSYEPRCLKKQFNRSYANRYRMLVRLKDAIYRFTRGPAFKWLWYVGRALGMRTLYRRINMVSSDSVIPKADARTLAILRERFASEVRELSRLLGKPLDDWL